MAAASREVVGATAELVQRVCSAEGAEGLDEACDLIDAAVVASVTEFDSGE
jgi:hypothetical protein